MRRGTVIALAAMVAFAGACSRTKTLDAQQLNGMIASDLQAKVGLQGVAVTCPDDVPAEAGRTFDCTATDADGTTMTIEVAQSDDQGHVTYKVVGSGSGP